MGINRRFGDYLLLERIASGGMAEIYLALKRGPGRFEKLVALKMIAGGHAEDELYLKMFQTEAELAALFNHPHVVQLYDVVTIEGRLCMVMEFMPGRTLAEVVEAAQAANAVVPPDLAAFLMMEVCEGLHYVHTLASWTGEPLGIVHRDVSPQNVMLTRDGVAKVFDFGIAFRSGRTDAELEGAMAGKFAYMSPEQCRSEPVDQRSDVFSLGAMLWELAVGLPLFSDMDQFSVIRVLTEQSPIPRPSERYPKGGEAFPRFLERIIMKALDKNPDRRHSSCEELREELNKYLKVSALKPNRKKSAELMANLFPEEDRQVTRLMGEVPRDIVETVDEIATMEVPRSGSGLQASQMAAQLLPDDEDMGTVDRTLEVDGRVLVAQVIAAEEQVAEDRARASLLDLSGIDPDTLDDGNVPSFDREIPMALPTSIAAGPAGRSGNRALIGVLVLGVAIVISSVIVAFVLYETRPVAEPAQKSVPVATAGRLNITSEPSGAAVELNGRRLSVKTPTSLPGLAFDEPIIVVLVKDGFETASKSFTFTPRSSVQVFDVSLDAVKKAPVPKAVGRLTITTQPSDVLVMLDDVKVADATPTTIKDISVGSEHTLKITREGYTDATLAFSIGNNEVREIEIELIEVSKVAAAGGSDRGFRFRVGNQGEDTKAKPFEAATTEVVRILDGPTENPESDAVAVKTEPDKKPDPETPKSEDPPKTADPVKPAKTPNANADNAGSREPPPKKEPVKKKPSPLDNEPYPLLK